jgi:hypothetical protein
MSLFRSLWLALPMATVANTAFATQVSRTLMNTDASNLYFMTMPTAFVGTPNRQMFLNNLDFANSLWLQVGGQMNIASNTISLKIYDGCGTLVTQTTKVFDNSGLTTPTSKKFVEIPLGSLPLVYGAYYYFDFKLNLAQPTFVANTDRFGRGTLTAGDVSELMFPDKKRDVMFILSGTADSNKAAFAPATTNIACPSRCILANPSGVENVSYGADQQFNIVIRERVGSMNPANGSFWSDQTAGTIAMLKQEIAAMLAGTSTDPALRETYPYNNYAQGPGQPFYYPQTNFYIAIEDPAVDVPSSNGNGHRGFHHCANIDASIEVVTGPFGYGAALGYMFGEVNRPAASTSGWGTGMRRVSVHEVFGHGVPALADEYIVTSASGSDYHNVGLMQNFVSGYVANALPISSGCTEWCGGTQPVSWLIGQMGADRDAACWSKTTQSTCESPGGFAVCRWIGGLPAIPYWGTNQCIPVNAAKYSIGTNCPAFGNHGCYPLAPMGTAGAAIMDVVQPSGFIMQSWHQQTSPPGFTSHGETHIKDMLDCVFPVMACQATPSRCTNLGARYGTAGSGYKTFLKNANACDAGFLRRR